MKKILVIEADQSAGNLLLALLTSNHYTAHIATDGKAGLKLATSENYDLILQGILPGELSGIKLCRELRKQGYQKPILFLTTKETGSDMVSSLDAGADDYIVQPVDTSELMARIRALLRRQDATSTPSILTWGELHLNPVSAEVRYQGQLLTLTPKEYSLLELFLSQPQRVFSRSAIIDRLWSLDAFPTENAVTTHIKCLRQQLKAAGLPADLIETVYGLGYRLKASPKTVAPVEELDHEKPKNAASLQICKILILDQDIAFIERLRSAISNQGFQIEPATNLAIIKQVVAKLSPHIILLNPALVDTTENRQTLQDLAEISSTIPILALSERDSFLDRIMISRLGGRRFLHKSLPTEQIVQAILQVLPRTQTNEATVMVASDDPIILSELTHLLQPWGLQLIPLRNPQQFWDVLTATTPDLLILDMEIPNISGTELCQVVRQDPQWGDLPILVLTGNTGTDLIAQIFAAGADDFVSKPILGPELVTRVVSRLERVPLRKQLEEIRQNAGKQPQPKQESQANILLVDDHPDNLRSLAAILDGKNYKIRKAISGEVALRTVQSQPPDLILLDIRMPGLDGYAVCSALKASPETRDIPIIFLSALDDAADKVKAFTVGGSDYITKPFQAEEVLIRIKYQLTIQQQRQQLVEQNQQLQWEIQERKRVEMALREREAASRPLSDT